MIPVYTITIPEYKLKFTSKKKPLVEIENFGKISKFYADNVIGIKGIGSKIDKVLKKHFLGKYVVIRCVGSQEHKGKTVDDIIKIIKKIGTDRYDPNRKGDRYENIEGKHIDFFGLDFKIKKDSVIMEQFVEPFYFWPLIDRGKPVKIDIVILYDVTKITEVVHHYEGRENETKSDGYVFKEDDKANSILGIINIK